MKIINLAKCLRSCKRGLAKRLSMTYLAKSVSRWRTCYSVWPWRTLQTVFFYRRTRHNTCARRTLQNVFIIDVPVAVPVLDVLCKMSLSSTYPAQRPCLTYLAKCLYYRRTRHNACAWHTLEKCVHHRRSRHNACVWHTLQNVCINTTCELDVSCQMS